MDVVDDLLAKQYLSFTLERELYAVKVLNVREVLERTRITKIPGMVPYILGIINLRGTVVPVADLRLRFDLAPEEDTIDTRIVVTELSLEGEQVVMGLLVDTVQEVLDIVPEQIQPPPQVGTKVKTCFIEGMGQRENDFIILLNLKNVFTLEEMRWMAETSASEGMEI